MNDELEAAKIKAEKCYNTAADHYDDEPLGFWERYGRRTVERLELRPGARVLDVCCGAGASALPAAQIVGPEGSVLGVDLAAQLLALARAKADASGLRNVEFRRGDMTALGFPDQRFDAVVCVFPHRAPGGSARNPRQLCRGSKGLVTQIDPGMG